MKSIYLDYASITPMDPRVRKEMDTWSREPLNPSSIHSLGVKAKKVVDESRKITAEFLNAHANEIIFTSGGTEANALALEGAGRAAHRNGFAKPHIIISAIEHSSIVETANMLEKHGVEVTRLPVDKNGLVSLEQLKKSIRPETYMVSIMAVNNEIGTIQPIREIAKIIRDARKKNETTASDTKTFLGLRNSLREIAPVSPAGHSSHMPLTQAISARSDSPRPSESSVSVATCHRYPLFHTDACQAVLYEELNVEKLGIDLLTLDASKAYGPRGVGALYVKRGTPIEALILGGGQERNLRSGTENVPGIAAFGAALLLAKKNKEKENQRIAELRSYFESEVKKIRPDAIINGENVLDSLLNKDRSSSRSPHISNITFPNIDAEMLVVRLDAKGVAVSTKSACLRDEDESYVLRAIGADSKSSVRFSFGRWTKKGDLKKVLGFLKKILVKYSIQH